MSSQNARHALDAFVRLLRHAHAGGQAKVDALLALSQRTLFLPRGFAGEPFAKLVNENGDWALPVFTSRDELEHAADTFGWRRSDGTVAVEELGARRALHHAIQEEAAFVVIDAAAPHALEASRAEIEPLVSTLNRSDAAGPFAGVGRISSSMLQAIRPSELPPPPVELVESTTVPQQHVTQGFEPLRDASTGKTAPASGTTRVSSVPPAPASSRPAPPISSRPAPPISSYPDIRVEPSGETSILDPVPAMRRTPRPPTPTSNPARFADELPTLEARDKLDESGERAPSDSRDSTPDSVEILVLPGPAEDEFYADLTEVLRAFPEVEWATHSLARRGASEPLAAIGLRIDTSFRANVDEIVKRLRGTALGHSFAVDVLLLDNPEVARAARNLGEVFYPWRRKNRA